MHIIELIFAISRLLNKQCALDSMVETSKGLPAAYDLCTLNEIAVAKKKNEEMMMHINGGNEETELGLSCECHDFVEQA